ncbi:MAG: DNA repair protein RecO [Clostridiaceae bacterium]|jgi:DNA repair protein RecO (recombination protein O)|nr:DNA repair protein RecO [Clostridiaceae bacterium]
MAVIKTKGIVIKEVPYNDTDKILTLITEDLGKISVSAKNARRSGSRASYGTQVLTYGEYVLFKGNSGFYLNSCDVLVNYYNLAQDLVCFTHAAHILEMAEDTAQDPALSSRILILLLYALQALSKGRNPLLISSAFALKLMQISGYPPHVCSCAVCDTYDIENIYFSFKSCGFICENCSKRDTDAIMLDVGAAKGILYVLCAEKGGIFNFELSDKLLSVFSTIAFRYISQQHDKSYRKLEILNNLNIN